MGRVQEADQKIFSNMRNKMVFKTAKFRNSVTRKIDEHTIQLMTIRKKARSKSCSK